MANKEIGHKEVRWLLQQKLNQSPLQNNEKYYFVYIALPISESMSFSGVLTVVAKSENTALDKAFTYATEMKEKDDIENETNWAQYKTNNTNKMTLYQFDVIIGPANEEEYINEYLNNWDDYVKTDNYKKSNSILPLSGSSFIGEWKWPIISIPIIIMIICFLEQISNQY